MKKRSDEALKTVRHPAHPHPRPAAARPAAPYETEEETWSSGLDTRSAGREEATDDQPAGQNPNLQPVRFGYFCPEARDVFLAGSFNGWDPRAHPMQRDAFGDWSLELALPPGDHRYRLIVDGEWCDDPSAQRLVANPYGSFDAIIQV